MRPARRRVSSRRAPEIRLSRRISRAIKNPPGGEGFFRLGRTFRKSHLVSQEGTGKHLGAGKPNKSVRSPRTDYSAAAVASSVAASVVAARVSSGRVSTDSVAASVGFSPPQAASDRAAADANAAKAIFFMRIPLHCLAHRPTLAGKPAVPFFRRDNGATQIGSNRPEIRRNPRACTHIKISLYAIA